MSPDDPKLPVNPTPIMGASTDISPLTHTAPKPPHERTAADEAGTINWAAIAASPRFKELLRVKRRFIIPAMIFFILYYFALLAPVGYARPLMEKRVLRPVNIAYPFAPSQFFMARIISPPYVPAAQRFHRHAPAIHPQDFPPP